MCSSCVEELTRFLCMGAPAQELRLGPKSRRPNDCDAVKHECPNSRNLLGVVFRERMQAREPANLLITYI